MDKNFHKEFTKCPNCGSGQRFCEQLGQELKDRGLARPGWTFSYDVRSGMVIDANFTQTRMFAGATLPGFAIAIDICMDCGTLYAVRLNRLDGKVKPMPKQGHPIVPPTNNPRFS